MEFLQRLGPIDLVIVAGLALGVFAGFTQGMIRYALNILVVLAAFIVAVRGTVGQAVLLGLAATLSHTSVVWIFAMGGLYFGRNWNAEATEPYFQVASAVLIILIALWMMWRTMRQRPAGEHNDAHGHGHEVGHSHHHDETKRIDTGHGVVRLDVFEDGVPPRFRLFGDGKHGRVWTADQVLVACNN